MMAFVMGLRSIAPAALQESLRSGTVAVVDVNSARSFEKAHVPGAKHLDPAGFAESDLPARKDALLVFYCSNPLCRKAPNAARRAKSFGYSDVRVMSAGITGWLSAKLPTESSR